MSALLLFVGIMTLRAQSTPVSQEAFQPLPELRSFLQEVRKNLRSDRVLLSQYTYLETDTERHFDRKGNLVKTEVKIYEVYPSLEQDQTYRKLISKNGRPLSVDELQKQDREYEKKTRRRGRKLQQERSSDREKRSAGEAEERLKEDEVIDELFRLYEISMVRRETLDSRPTIVLDFKPRLDFRPRTDPGKILKRMEGRAWINEKDHHLIRVEAALMDNLSFGLGILARLNKGARVFYQRRRVNDEIWLPAEYRFAGTGRLFLFKGVRIDAHEEYSDYKKFTVETSVGYRDKKP